MECADNARVPAQQNAKLSTFFDALPTEVLRNILIWVDSILCDTRLPPLMGDDEEYVRDTHKLLFLIFPLVSPFRAAASTMFTELCIHCDRKTSFLDIGLEGVEIGAELFEGTKRQKEVIPQVFSVCGASITRIHVFGPSRESGTRTQSFFSQTASLVLQYCRNVEKLVFLDFPVPPLEWEQARAILHEYAPQLHNISWENNSPMIDGQVSQVVPDFSACSNLKSFQCPSIHSERMILLLQSFGESLEDVSISLKDSKGYSALLDAVQDKCTRLSSIDLGDIREVILEVGEDRYCSFICSFGEKLISTELRGMSYENLKEIIRVCSKLEFSLFQVNETLLNEWEYFDTIAPRLVDLDIANITLTNEECLNTMAKCSNLRNLFIEGADYDGEYPRISDEAMTNVFSCSSFHELEYLQLCGFTATPQNVALIATKTSKLNSARFGVRGTIKNGSVFKQLVDSNPNFGSIDVIEDENCEPERNCDSTLDTLRELMETFSMCRKIEISLLRPQECEVGEDKVREICGYVRCRGIELHIRVGGAAYEQTDFPHGMRPTL